MAQQIHPGTPTQIDRELLAPNNQAFLQNLRTVQCGKDSALKDAISETHEYILQQQQVRFGGQTDYEIYHIIIASEEDTESQIIDEKWQEQITKIKDLTKNQKFQLIFISLDQSRSGRRQLEVTARQFNDNSYLNQSKMDSLKQDTQKILEKQLKLIKAQGYVEAGNLIEMEGLKEDGISYVQSDDRKKYIVLFTLDASEKMNSQNRWNSVCDAVAMIISKLKPTEQIQGTVFNEGTAQVTRGDVTRWNQMIDEHKRYKIDTDFKKDYVCQIF